MAIKASPARSLPSLLHYRRWRWLNNIWHCTDELVDSAQLLIINSCLTNIIFIIVNNGKSSLKPVDSKWQHLQFPFEEGLHVKMLVVLQDLFDCNLLFVIAALVQDHGGSDIGRQLT